MLAEVSSGLSSPELTAVLDRWAPDGPGLSIAHRRRGVLETAAAGLADLSMSVPMSARSVVNTGSIAKSVVGRLIRQDVEVGLVKTEDCLDAYIPVPPEWVGRIPLAALLQHRSGIWDFRSVLQILGRGASDTVATGEVSRIVFSQSVDNLPAAIPTPDLAYSNSNYLLLGLVLEAVHARPLAEQVADQSRNTGCNLQLVRSPRTVVRGLARGYERTAHDTYLEWRFWVDGCGASNLFASPTDLLRWGQVLAQDECESPTEDGYDLGRYKVAGRWLIASGDDGGCRTSLVVDLRTQDAVSVAAIAGQLDVQALCMAALGVKTVELDNACTTEVHGASASEPDPTGSYYCADLMHRIDLERRDLDLLILLHRGRPVTLHRVAAGVFTDGHSTVELASDTVLLTVNHARRVPFRRIGGP